MTMTLEGEIHFRKRGRGWRREIVSDPEPPPPVEPRGGRVPRVARLMALAIRFDELLEQGIVKDYVELAELGRVSAHQRGAFITV